MTGGRFKIATGLVILGLAALALAQVPASAPAPAAQPVTKTAATPAAMPVLTDKPLWKELSAPQKLALDPLKLEWDRLDSARKAKWIDIANRYSSMKPDEQVRVQDRMRAWTRLSPEERRVARENYTLSKKIDKTEKASQWEQYQQLPEEQKRKLAADAAVKKQKQPVTALPPKTQPKAIAPIKKIQCPAGTVRNANPVGPSCVPGAATPAVIPPPPAAPAVPVPNAK
ncbi:DUF3106 domain-containing protein [Massilia sp. CF038]|uniref:DUF3106 domain-containing protein n=1 Tax=Massilia sp. CF038 TaxID=1881045 RepID=UPI00091314D6|nr:DUF3106 domain-containing protein [Massilia sp. CF038]SHG55107.1 Protein of unknown function [Massilia sp. CF038]